MKQKGNITKTVSFFSIMFVVILLFSSIIYSDSGPWNKIMDRSVHKIHVDDNNTLIEFDALLYERQQENSNGNNRINAILGKDQSIDMSKSNEFTIVIEDEEIKLYVDSHGNVHSPNSSIFITQTKNKETISFNFNNNLYVLDVKSKDLRKVSFDEVEEYNKKKYIELVKLWSESPPEEDYHPTPLVWVYASAINEDGNYIIYESNRRGFEKNSPSNDIWLKNLKTDEEDIVVQNAQFVSWLDKETFSYHKGRLAGTYHIPTGLVKEAKVTDGLFGITHKYAIYATADSVVIVNLESHGKSEVKLEDATTVINGTVSPGGEEAAVIFYKDSHESAWIAVINLNKGEIDRTLNPPEIGLIHFDSNGKIIVWSHERETTWIEK